MKDVGTVEHNVEPCHSGFNGFMINFLIVGVLLLIGNVKLGLAVTK